MKNKLDRSVHVVNLLFLIGSMIGLIDYVMPGGWATKGMTSSWFVVIGLINLGYAMMERISKISFVVIIVLGLILEKVLIGYAIIIAAMLGKALSNYLADKSLTNKLIMIGSAMFWFSDLMLAFNMFGNGGQLAGRLCSFTYWPGQCILAYALYHFVRERKENKSKEGIYE